MKLRSLSFTIFAIVLAACGSGAAQSNPILHASRDASQLQLSLSAAGPGMAHWRIDAGALPDGWLPIGPLTSLDGAGTVSLNLPPPGQTGATIYRAMLDQSAANVLSLPEIPYNYTDLALPPHLQTAEVQNADNNPPDNPVTDAGATLGRVLFYDTKLSDNHAVSCASCHQPEHGFSDPVPFSAGLHGERTQRNSPGLTSVRYYQPGRFFWDERIGSLEEQALTSIQNEVEMGMDLDLLVQRLGRYPYYQALFEDAFGDSTITSNRIARALAQFVRSIVSTQSKYDIGVATDFANFTAQEELGRQSFHSWPGRCSGCHDGHNFVGTRPENNGLEYPYVDDGVGGVTGADRDMGRFKMHSLRNVELTAPYMHDGRFATLVEVVGHYSTNVVVNPNLGRRLRSANFTVEQRDALVAFLKTLTDTVLTTDPRFSDPFRKPE